MPNSFQKLQVKSSGQYLNIFQVTNTQGQYACQGVFPTTQNFYWDIIESPSNPGWYLFKVKNSGMYLNVLNDSKLEGASVGQNSLRSEIGAPENFLWNMVDVPNKPGWFLIQSMSSGQYLMISGGGNNNGQPAVQGVVDDPTSPETNTMWQIVVKDSKPVKVTLEVDCENVYQLPEGPISDDNADAYLVFSDDNNGRKENNHQSSFQSIVNPGSSVNWVGNTKRGQNNDYNISIDNITYDLGTGTGNIFTQGITKGNGNVNAQVAWTALTPDSGDNEFYTVNFTIEPKKGGSSKSYSVDPRMKVLAKGKQSS